MTSIQLFSPLRNSIISGTQPEHIEQLCDDSRQIQAESCYVAIRGTKFDGHSVIDQAIESGAIAIVAESPISDFAKEKGTYWLQVSDSRIANGILMSEWNGNPSQELIVLGVTGTNGKTTISYLCNHIFRNAWQRAGLIGTIVYDDGINRRASKNTTPGSAELQSTLALMVQNRCRAVVMEVSSHALDQERTAGTHFRVCIFTNLTQDHLDYHGTMENYYQAKKKIFLQMANGADRKSCAIINIDDSYGERLAEELRPIMRVRTFGTTAKADLFAKPSILSIKGSQFELIYQGKSYLVRTPLIGDFNISNSLAAIAGAQAAGVSLRDAITSISQSPQVPGRVELISSVNNVQCFIDYAHTPDALDKLCNTMKQLCRTGRLITVFGCGGDRDTSKRHLMGIAAAKSSNICIVTSDNPRSESPDAIIDQIMTGIPLSKQKRITDRKEAILAAIDMTRSGDVILIAGKGHEEEQIIGDQILSFSDMAIVKKYYAEKNPEGTTGFNKPPGRDDDAPRAPRSFDSDDRAPRSFDRDDRGPRNFDRDDRAPRSFDRDDRAPRSFDRDDRGPRSFDRDDRAPRNFNRDDRAPRSFDRDDRGPRNFNRDDRAPRSFDRDDRGPRNFNRDDRAPRSFDRDDRGPRNFNRDDRAPRSFDRDDRGPRNFNRDDRGPRNFDRDDRGPRNFDRDDRGPRNFDRDDRGPRNFDRDGRGPRNVERPSNSPTSYSPSDDNFQSPSIKSRNDRRDR